MFHEVIDTMTSDCCSNERDITRLPSATSSFTARSLSLRGFAPSISLAKRWRGGQVDDFVTAQRFQKWLDAAAHETAQSPAVDLHLAGP